MNSWIATTSRLTAAAGRVAVAAEAGAVDALTDAALLALLKDATEARNALDVIVASASAVVERRSARDRGVAGLAQQQGHRNSTSLLQSLTGQSKAEVGRAVRAGEDLVPVSARLGGWGGGAGGVDDGGLDGAGVRGPVDDARPSEPRWRVLLRDALTGGQVGQAQFHAIRGGLGEPPVDRYPDLDPGFLPDAWAVAVERLIDEAPDLPVEALRSAAQIARDRLDPVGVTLRFEERFAARSFRMWIDEHGQRHARLIFDDDAAAWVDAILQAALRPRRGPRFVDTANADPDSGGAPSGAGVDERSNEQLSYDTIMAVLRTGAAADPTQAFGDRQPGVRIVVEATAITTHPDPVTGQHMRRVTGVGHLEDGGHALPGGVVETYLCDAGSLTVTLDPHGRPLDVGRERRLFTRKQRIAIAVRDGGCIGQGCTAPISQVEMHHIDHWAQHHGRTDTDDGVPLCRNHHLGLHNRHQHITRHRNPHTGQDTYLLHDPPDPHTGELHPPRPLRTRTPRRFHAA